MTTWYRSIDAVAHGDHRLQVQAWPPCAAACESIPIGGTCRLARLCDLGVSFVSEPNRPSPTCAAVCSCPPPVNLMHRHACDNCTHPPACRPDRTPQPQQAVHLASSLFSISRTATTSRHSTTNRNSWIHDILQICTAKLAATCNAAVDVCGAALPSALCVLHTHIREYLQLHSHSACQQRHGLAGPFVAKAVEMAILHRAELWASRHRRRCACVERSGR
jgi:hypothetical protein